MPRGYRKYDFKGGCRPEKEKKSWKSNWEKKKDFDKKCWKVVDRDDKGRDGCGRDKDKKKKYDCVEEEVCTEYKIDFEFGVNSDLVDGELSPGDVVEAINFEGLVVTVNAQENPSSDGFNPDNDAMIFDSSVDEDDASGEDPDLVTEGQNNILIISEDDNADDPDDAEDGGVFVFTFSEAVNLTSLYVRDSEFTTITSNDGTVVEQESLEDRGEAIVNLESMDNVTQLTVELAGSGAIDDLIFELCVTETVCVRDCDYGI